MKISVITPSIRPEGLKIVQQSLEKQTFQDFEWLTEIGIPGRGHDLNAAYNRALRRARGELIVSLQDFIKAPPQYLQKFWDTYQKEKTVFWTAPVGKVNNLEYTGKIIWDWRAFADAAVDWKCWEIDSGAAPLSALRQIGGFDEELDGFWSCDNLNVGCRADIAGFKVKNLLDNPVIAYDHDAHIAHPFRERFLPQINNDRMELFRNGLKIDYLRGVV